MMNTSNEHCDNKFVYHTRGYIKNLNIVDGTATFNIAPHSLHRSDINVDGNILPSITLIGRRVITTEHGMKREEKLFPVLSSAKFRCVDATRFPIEEGACRMFQIGEDEVQRVESLVADPNLVVNVKGVLVETGVLL